MNITEAIEKLKGMEIAETHTLHLLHHHDGRRYGRDDDEFNYCYDCAKSIYDFLIGKGEKPVAKYLDIPDWKGCTKKNTEIRIDGGQYGYDSGQFCHLCGCILDVGLTDEGIKSELDHLESIEEIISPEDKRTFLNVLVEIEYVERAYFPDEFLTSGEVKEAKQLYKRAMALLCKLKENEHNNKDKGGGGIRENIVRLYLSSGIPL